MNSAGKSGSRRIALAVLAGILIGSLFTYFALSQQVRHLDEQLTQATDDIGELGQEISSLREEVSELDPGGLPISNQTFAAAEIYREAKDSVVFIRIFVQDTSNLARQGSGFVYDVEGRIITNNHVVEGASSLGVTFPDGSELEAELVGTDPYSDLAIIEVDPSRIDLNPLELGNSSLLRVGDPVVAIGNPFGLEGTLTTGVVSQKGRSLRAEGGYLIPNVIQIDAAINPGNSGGPLLNFRGEVVGITTAIESGTGEFSGVGFAVPSDTVTREIDDLIATGTYDHPWLGVVGYDMRRSVAEEMGIENTSGWLIAEVLPDGPADGAGLMGGDRTVEIEGAELVIGGDLIVGIDGTQIRNGDDLSSYLERHTRPGQVISIFIIRDGTGMTIDVTLGVRPPP